MPPFERFKNLLTTGNIWIYILVLSKENPLPKNRVEGLIFEKFGFLPGKIITQVVLKKLENNDYIKSKKFQGEKSYIATEKGKKELQRMQNFYQNLIQKF